MSLFQLWGVTSYANEIGRCDSIFNGTHGSKSNYSIAPTVDLIREFYPDINEKYQRIKNFVDTKPESTTPFLSIVIPAYREERRLPTSLRELKLFFDRYPLPVEIIIVVQNSTDKTVEVAQNNTFGDSRFIVVDKPIESNEGKGSTVRHGMKLTHGEYALFMDADLSTPLPEIFNFINFILDNPEIPILIGDRKSEMDKEAQGRTPVRKLMSSTFYGLTRAVTSELFKDTQCGFKLFHKIASENIFSIQSINGFAFDIEIILIAKKLNYKIKSLPIKWFDSDFSTVNKVLDPLKMLVDLLRIKSVVDQNIQLRQQN